MSKYAPAFITLALTTFSATSALAEGCRPILFPKGKYGVVIKGVSPYQQSGQGCYNFTSQAGKEAHVSISSQDNIVLFSIAGVADIQQDYRFLTERQKYIIQIVTPWPYSGVNFSLTVQIK